MQDTKTKNKYLNILSFNNSFIQKLKLMLHKIQSCSYTLIHHLKIIILLLALPCLALQCDKEDDKNDPEDVTRLSEEFKDYAYFKEGSWWVYKELNSGHLDSAYIIRSDIFIDHIHERYGGPEDFEHLSTKIIRDFNSDKIPDTLTLEGFPALKSNSNAKRSNGVNTLTQTISKFNVSRNVILFTPVKLDDKVNNKYNPEIVWQKDSFKIHDKWYKNVVKTKHTDSQNTESNELIRSDYFAKNVGLIKRVFWDGRVKELLRYNVEQ